jgi:hypothetical protein
MVRADDRYYRLETLKLAFDDREEGQDINETFMKADLLYNYVKTGDYLVPAPVVKEMIRRRQNELDG